MDSSGPRESDSRHTATYLGLTCRGDWRTHGDGTPVGESQPTTTKLAFLDSEVLHRPIGRVKLRGFEEEGAVPETGLRDGFSTF